ncbi:MAG: hypothetical protein F6J97_20080 [Leptolyngbya sp. SIO4C1]|nr:hypothetical protein [Leptolyngbya sp. SIO4C1]
MTLDEQLTVFRTAYQNLELMPLLTQAQVEQFGVEYQPDLIDKLEQQIEDSARPRKLIFTGHRGCGKSTLLAEFGHLMADRYFIVFFSIADLIEMSDVDS